MSELYVDPTDILREDISTLEKLPRFLTTTAKLPGNDPVIKSINRITAFLKRSQESINIEHSYEIYDKISTIQDTLNRINNRELGGDEIHSTLLQMVGILFRLLDAINELKIQSDSDSQL